MELIKQWALGITISAIAGAVILVLSPQGATEKIVKTAVSLFLLCAMLTPFMKNIDVNALLDTKISNEEADTENIESGVIQTTKQAVRQKIDEILSTYGIKAEEINIDISIDDEKQMSIDNVAIVINGADAGKMSQAKEEIIKQLGIEVKTEVTQ